MHVYIDADACPVIKQVEEIAAQYDILVTLLCDTNHVLRSNYSEVQVVSSGADAVDLALINLCRPGDIVVTQDYGVAALALGKGAYAIHQNGWRYTQENIDGLLMERHLAKKARRANHKVHLRGPKKRTIVEDNQFFAGFQGLLRRLIEEAEQCQQKVQQDKEK